MGFLGFMHPKPRAQDWALDEEVHVLLTDLTIHLNFAWTIKFTFFFPLSLLLPPTNLIAWWILIRAAPCLVSFCCIFVEFLLVYFLHRQLGRFWILDLPCYFWIGISKYNDQFNAFKTKNVTFLPFLKITRFLIRICDPIIYHQSNGSHRHLC